MRTYLLSLILLGVALFLFFLSRALHKPIEHALWREVSFILATDLAEYAKTHQNHLPPNWEEFINWANKRNPKRVWKQSELEKRFRISWSQEVSINSEQKIIQIIDPDIQNAEAAVQKHFFKILKSTP
jgi:hypothetical protein